MAILDDATLGLSGPVSVDVVRRRISREAWTWFWDNQDYVVVEQRVLFVKVKVRVRDLRWVFERLFGPDPLAAT